MKIEIDIPDYSPPEGLRFVWEDDFTIVVEPHGDGFIIRANRDGLISLARHLLTLAQENVPPGWHFHLDDSNSLENGSCELIVEKIIEGQA